MIKKKNRSDCRVYVFYIRYSREQVTAVSHNIVRVAVASANECRMDEDEKQLNDGWAIDLFLCIDKRNV